MRNLFYFGTIGEVGHHWFGCQSALGPMIEIPWMSSEFFRRVDGLFCPPENIGQQVYRYSTVGNLQIVSWNDRTIDKRPGSNSNLIGYGFIDAEEMLTEAEKKFPQVMKRQSRPQSEFLCAVGQTEKNKD